MNVTLNKLISLVILLLQHFLLHGQDLFKLLHLLRTALQLGQTGFQPVGFGQGLNLLRGHQVSIQPNLFQEALGRGVIVALLISHRHQHLFWSLVKPNDLRATDEVEELSGSLSQRRADGGEAKDDLESLPDSIDEDFQQFSCVSASPTVFTSVRKGEITF